MGQEGPQALPFAVIRPQAVRTPLGPLDDAGRQFSTSVVPRHQVWGSHPKEAKPSCIRPSVAFLRVSGTTSPRDSEFFETTRVAGVLLFPLFPPTCFSFSSAFPAVGGARTTHRVTEVHTPRSQGAGPTEDLGADSEPADQALLLHPLGTPPGESMTTTQVCPPRPHVPRGRWIRLTPAWSRAR